MSCTNGLALPSAAGNSAPSTRTSRLSMPRPAAAAMRCSIVWMRAPVATNRRRVMRVDDALGRGGNGIAVLTDAEDDARVRGAGRQRDANRLSRVQPNTFQADRLADGVLSHDLRREGATRVPHLHLLLNSWLV